MRSWISTAHCKDRGFLILIFVFMLSILLVVSRRGIHTSDGYIEFLVAQRWTESGELDLPKYENLPDSRVQRGVDGKYYSVYGIGNSVLFAVTITMDKALIDLIGSINRSGFDFGPPFLFSIAANAFVLALTGVYLWRILKLLGIASDPALLASTLYVFTSMALVYSTLSFDISLACLMLLLMLFYLFRYHETGLKKNLLLAGAAFGSQVITRFSFAAFVLPVLYALMWRGPGNREEAKTAPSRMALFLIAVIPFGLWILYYNSLRFGSPLSFGYERIQSFASSFSTSPLVSIPALLLSPGRSIFVYSPTALLGLAGLAAFSRHKRTEFNVVMMMIILNLVVHGLWYWWDSPGTWGPRFQLPVAMLMFIPAAFWLDEKWAWISGRIRKVFLFVFSITMGIQLGAILVGFPSVRNTESYWSLSSNQVLASLKSLFISLKHGGADEFNVWWLNPQFSGSITMMAILGGMLSLALISLVWVIRQSSRNRRNAQHDM